MSLALAQVLARSLAIEASPRGLRPHWISFARNNLMKLVTRRRHAGAPAHIRSFAAELTDDGESIMLTCTFAYNSMCELDGDPSNAVAIFFDRERGEEFDVEAVEASFAGVVQRMNDGFLVR